MDYFSSGVDIASSVVKMVLDFGKHGFAVGSCFLLPGKNGTCLATAFHNFSGGISPKARFYGECTPNPVYIELFYDSKRICRFSPYDNDRSLFRVHENKEKREEYDIAVLDVDKLRPFMDDEGGDCFFWEHPGFSAVAGVASDLRYALVEDMFLEAGHDALVFGYPGGRDFHDLPIGVSCKIAALDERTEPGVLLSGHTSAGCSGAPVVAREFGGYLARQEKGVERCLNNVALVDQWLGLYSGRLEKIGAGLGPRNTQIGVAWSAGSVMEVAQSGVYDLW